MGLLARRWALFRLGGWLLGVGIKRLAVADDGKLDAAFSLIFARRLTDKMRVAVVVGSIVPLDGFKVEIDLAVLVSFGARLA